MSDMASGEKAAFIEWTEASDSEPRGYAISGD
jgi:hypothetical protein